MLKTVVLLYLACALTHCQESCGYYNVTDTLGVLDYSPQIKYLRPVTDWREATKVTVDVVFRAILEMDEKLQILQVLMDFEMSWGNALLTWDPQDHCEISRISIPYDSVWIPDIYISEMTEDNSIDVNYLHLYHDGTIAEMKTLQIVLVCILDLYKFPFDTQKCSFTFGTRTNTDNQFSCGSLTALIKRSIFDGERVEPSQCKILLPSNITRNDEEWSKVIYEIIVQRAPILYVINLIIPACLLVGVDVASMFIPMEGGERMGFKITVVLGFSVLLIILNDFLPSTTNPPILGVFCMVCLLIMIISIIDSIFISYMLHLSAIRPHVPQWLKIWVLVRLAFIVRIDTKAKLEAMSSDNKEVGSAGQEGAKDLTASVNIAIEAGSAGQEGAKDLTASVNTALVANEETPAPPETTFASNRQIAKKSTDSAEIKLLKRLLLELLMVRRHLIATKTEESAKSEWHVVAFVLDRFILILYILTGTFIMLSVVIVWIF
ncbi:5-hydroxytryptamine receptor 3A-like [Bombina bombina]|uniref:5-hydroxytryptamine receptor 3A-like n=1 Tax=Bombina bombina TaxID=8345 RepID=UPI00235A66FF|nr:5-hydroxytryptamine receptor 3A-like [Bombina bombina]